MDPGFVLSKENPKKKANIVSRLFFVWMARLYYKSIKFGLKVSDLYISLDCDKSKTIGDELERNWEKELARSKMKGKDPSFFRAIFDSFFTHYMLIGLMVFFQYAGVKALQPVALSYLIRLFTKINPAYSEMYITGAILIGLTILNIFLNHHCMKAQMLVGMRVRVAISALTYRKILKLSRKSLGETAAGQVVNLLSNDVNRFDQVSVSLHQLWISPFLVAIITYFIWTEVGISALAGIVAMIALTFPLQAFLGKKSSSIRRTIAGRTDFRVRLMNEIIAGVQVIKMYAWEKPFEILVKEARAREIRGITIASYIRAILLSSMVFVERTALFFTVLCYVLLGNSITADKVFSMQQFFNTLQLSMAIFCPMAVSMGAEALVSIKRFEKFLLLEEKEQAMIDYQKSDTGIRIEQVTAAWSSEKITIHNLTLNVPKGSLCAIVGPVGAGKSSILQLLLGELPQKTGSISINGNISYSSQEPWLFVATVRNNILFGQEYNKDLYDTVVKVCALERDFKQFPQGDRTKVGERGVSLSGGQRARINLARAVYREADIYLMDDPLSAVDTHVGKHLFDKCIMSYLKGKTRILVTHQLQYLKKADIIIVVNNGKIEAQGSFEELTKSDLDFTKMLVSADESQDNEEEHKFPRTISVISSTMSAESTPDEKMVDTNEEEIGMKKGSAFKEYFKAGGGWFVTSILAFILIAGQVACSCADFWITFWTDQVALNESISSENRYFLERIISKIYSPNETSVKYHVNNHPHLRITTGVADWLTNELAIYIYSGIIISAICITMIRSFLFFHVAMKASRNLHGKMFHSLLEAPMRFFDTNPSGRILNRFSKDMGCIDEFLPRILIEAVQFMLVTCGILVMVAISNYYMIISMVILGFLFVLLRNCYLKTVVLIKHIEGVTKSPVFSHLNSSLNGITTIRSCKVEETLINEFDHHQDVHTSAWFLTVLCQVSFGLWLDIIITVFVTVITFSFIILNQYDAVSGSMVGLAISQSLILTGMLQYGMRQSAEAMNQLTSVERVLQYTQLEKEGPFETPEDKKPPKNWPSKGHIIFDQMYLKYTQNDPPVLKNLNININPGEKIGIVGRTGAGKSSLISALFRLTLLEGKIIVDDFDTSTIGLNDVRKNISIIPQEPVLFSETIRYNLDPFNEYADSVLWNALEEVELKKEIPSLEYMVDGGGANFSLGQRQLVCLARAIVRNNKILILDEATANVDPRTDSLIQATIRRKFVDCTVLTIAHRLNTIMDSDRVLVLDGGQIKEFDHPHLLLQKENGVFNQMLKQTGTAMTMQLAEVARRAFEEKQLQTSRL